MNLYLYEMGLNRKKISKIFIIVFVLVLTGLFITKYVILNKFEMYIENLPSHIDVQYDAVDIDIMSGNLNFEQPLFTIKGQTTNEIITQIALRTIEIENISYWDYFQNNTINVNTVKLLKPKITYYHNKNVKDSSYHSSINGKLNQMIHIGEFEMTDSEIEIFDSKNDSIMFYTETLNLQLNSITFNASETEKFPLQFETIALTSKNLKYSLNEFDDLFVSSLNIATNKSTVSNLRIKTKYSKIDLSKHLKSERDYLDLTVPSIEILNHHLHLDRNSKMTFETDSIRINNPVVDLYRDKLVSDDYNHKPLYSKMLRDNENHLTLHHIHVNNADITYEEKVKLDRVAGKLEFSNVDATIKNLSNTYSKPVRTSISITSNFMKDTPLKTHWDFDVNDVNDEFIFKADIGFLKVDHLNQFMQPNLNVKLEGELIKTYFTVDGNANTSQVDLKTDYDEFNIVLLQTNNEQKNKFLSGLINIFISKDSQKKADRYRYSDTKTVERDKTKSVFNFVWKNAQSGLISAMTGGGKKEK